MTVDWLIDDSRPLTQQDLDKIERTLSSTVEDEGRGSGLPTPTIAVRLRDLVVHDNKALFGAANIRLDALVIHGNGDGKDPHTFYMPSTQIFPQVRDGDPLLMADSNLLIFHGPVKHFIDIYILLSRDTGQDDQLMNLLDQNLQSPGFKQAFTTVVGLAAAPHAAAVYAATQAAGMIGTLAYKLLRQLTGSTIGLYRQSFNQVREDFGLNPDPDQPGRYPATGSYKVQGFSFCYEILDLTPPSSD